MPPIRENVVPRPEPQNVVDHGGVAVFQMDTFPPQQAGDSVEKKVGDGGPLKACGSGTGKGRG